MTRRLHSKRARGPRLREMQDSSDSCHGTPHSSPRASGWIPPPGTLKETRRHVRHRVSDQGPSQPKPYGATTASLAGRNVRTWKHVWMVIFNSFRADQSQSEDIFKLKKVKRWLEFSGNLRLKSPVQLCGRLFEST